MNIQLGSSLGTCASAPTLLGLMDSIDDFTGFRAKVPVEIEWSRYLIKTVDSAEELKAALKLRHDVFYKELLNRETAEGIDHDKYDAICDHLVIIDTKSGELIGTYRFISSDFSDTFYTASEFHIEGLTAIPGLKIEMGRACIRSDFRSGFTFIALWKGLAAYVGKHRAQYFFGCSSVKTTDTSKVARICQYLRSKGHWHDTYNIQPRDEFVMPGLDEAIAQTPATFDDEEAMRAEVPPLLWAYLDAGATIHGPPALDRDFACVDFLTVLNLDNVREDLIRKYKPW